MGGFGIDRYINVRNKCTSVDVSCAQATPAKRIASSNLEGKCICIFCNEYVVLIWYYSDSFRCSLVRNNCLSVTFAWNRKCKGLATREVQIPAGKTKISAANL